ncbi:MAG: hypothetical protein BECKG1743D_GA0114223_102283 [Candidatus Kentron sp. G]|nr:MAG: hypothetical protein BECKG1743D_GA0114223_102283 [Candidatus Kentron sp. G]
MYLLFFKLYFHSNYVTVIATQKLDDKDKQVGIFFDRNRLRSTGCGPPRWISDNDYYQRLFRRKFKILPFKV